MVDLHLLELVMVEALKASAFSLLQLTLVYNPHVTAPVGIPLRFGFNGLLKWVGIS